MKGILVTDILILILTLACAVTSGGFFRMMLAGGLLLIVATMSYMNDGEDRNARILCFLSTCAFGALSGEWYGFLAVGLIPFEKPILRLILADVFFAACNLLSVAFSEGLDLHRLALCLFGVLLISVCSALIFLLQHIAQKEEKNRCMREKSLKTASLGEMHEMQKNSEMMLENYYEHKNAILTERENISRNIHNSVGHSITAAIMTLEAADMLFDQNPEEAHKRMNDAAGRIRGSLESIRTAVRALDSEDEDVSVSDLLCYTENIINEFVTDTDRSCDRVNDIYSESLMLPKEHAQFLSSALGELLTNGVKHGAATHFVVRIVADSSHIRLEVSDNGHSDFSENNSEERIKNGFGLKKLDSYAKRCGGSTEFKNEEGFRAAVELPLMSNKES
jgi:signal transduction histidine kinase